MIHRSEETLVRERLKDFPAVALLGPRQSGKTTLALSLKPNHHFDLENPSDFQALQEPKSALEGLSGLIVVDEVQRRPELFPTLRYLIDQKKRGRTKRFLILGSASPDLLRQSSESLAGRIAHITLNGLTLDDLPNKYFETVWVRGGFPRSLLARNAHSSMQWRKEYISTYLERDLPQLGLGIPSPSMRRFWGLLAHYHGQIVNYSELASSFGLSDVSVRHYIEILEATFMVRSLRPWHTNMGKREVKRPKIYFLDSGIFHTFLDTPDKNSLLRHPKLGASFEGFCLEMLSRHLHLASHEIFFWSIHSGPELDCVWKKRSHLFGAEFKFSDAPKFTDSMQSAIDFLHLEHLYVFYPGDRKYSLSKKCTVIPVWQMKSFEP